MYYYQRLRDLREDADKTQKEIEILAAFFTQLGDTLASISILNNPEK